MDISDRLSTKTEAFVIAQEIEAGGVADMTNLVQWIAREYFWPAIEECEAAGDWVELEAFLERLTLNTITTITPN